MTSEKDLRDLAATHRRAAEEYERQLAALEAEGISAEMVWLRTELRKAQDRISELEGIIERVKKTLDGYHFLDDDE